MTNREIKALRSMSAPPLYQKRISRKDCLSQNFDFESETKQKKGRGFQRFFNTLFTI